MIVCLCKDLRYVSHHDLATHHLPTGRFAPNREAVDTTYSNTDNCSTNERYARLCLCILWIWLGSQRLGVKTLHCCTVYIRHVSHANPSSLPHILLSHTTHSCPTYPSPPTPFPQSNPLLQVLYFCGELHLMSKEM